MDKLCTRCGLPGEFRARSDGSGSYARCRLCEAAAEKARYEARKYNPPPLEAIPEGFEVAKLSTQVDENGAPQKQHIGARPERPHDAPVIDAFQPGTSLKRLSTLTGGDGKVIQQWQIYTKEHEEREKREKWLLDAIGSLAEKWPVREPVKLAEGPACDERLMCVVPMGDPHFGQYSWAAETGDAYDLELAEQYHCTAMKALVDSAPRARRGKLINLGDFVHADNSDNRTLRGHHQLDVDTRWPKVIRSSVQSVIWLVNYMLTKFKEVDAWMVPGNHDPHSAFMLQLGLQLYFRNEPRVRVPEVSGLFYYERFGKSLIGSTHTHTIKDRASLGETMAVHQPKDWGESLYRYWYCGHVHHDSLIETKGGVIVETMRTLAGKDKFAAENAYNAGRDMKCDVFDIEDGRVQRNVIGIRQIQRRIKAQSAE
jgi:hypothetical protein